MKTTLHKNATTAPTIKESFQQNKFRPEIEAKKFKIAVHLHCYYTDLIDEMLGKGLSFLTEDYDLFVTLISPNKEIEKKIKKLKKDVKIIVVENRGYDVGPFIKFLNKIDLKKYDLILKLHTKKSEQKSKAKVNGEKWRRHLLSHLLPKKGIENILNIFRNDKFVGMLGTCLTNTIKHPDINEYFDVCEKFGVSKTHTDFFAGTMFWVRTTCLAPIKKKKIGIKDFDFVSKGVHSGTLAHGYERFFGRLVKSQGYQLKDLSNRTKQNEKRMFQESKMKKFFFQKKVTKSGRLRIKILKIPVWGKKIK
ncbi:MAG: rhamnan synthesis F family protein [Alphaproteobacteria bacterium]